MNYKKLVKRLLIILVFFVAILAAAPYLFKDQLKEAVLSAINKNVDAKVTVSDIDLSLFRSFPDASLNLENITIVNNKPFENDTLSHIEKLSLDLPIKELFKGEDKAKTITSISINDAFLNLISNQKGLTNYDISKPDDNNVENQESSSFNFDVEKYEIKNSIIEYSDEVSGIVLKLSDFNHSGSGELSAEKSELNTNSSGKLSFEYDKMKYFQNSKFSLDALIGIDLTSNTYTFLENEANISGLPLIFDGTVELTDKGQQMDINFKTPSSSFKNFLKIMPKEYNQNIADVDVKGDFSVVGNIKGLNNDNRIPNFNIDINSKNSSFKYPDLPKSVEDIIIKATIANETGNVDNTFVVVETLNFRIDKDVFNSSATAKRITINPFVNATLKGTINLDNISKAYPFEMEKELSGLLKMDINTRFDLDAVKKSKYKRIQSKGNLSVTDFIYKGSEFENPVNIKKASVNFTPTAIRLQELAATTGKTDFTASGTLKDFIGFLISNKELKGNFNLFSNTFSVNDFMTTSEIKNDTINSTEKSRLKIPSFLNCEITAEAKKVFYDNLELDNLKGKMIIKDEKVRLENLTSSLLGGDIALNGTISTENEIPTFSTTIGLNSLNISESFEKLDLLKSLAPIAKIIEGKINSTIQISGELDDNLAPDLGTVSGDATANIISDKINSEKSPLLSSLAGQLNFIDVDKLDLKDINAALSFENGKVNVKPFTVKYKDIDIDIVGGHGFDKSMDYNATFNVPAKYLGDEVSSLISNLSNTEKSKIVVPITANIGGDLGNPTIKTDLKSAVTNLTKQLIENNLKDKGSNLLFDLLNKSSNKQKDTTENSQKGAKKSDGKINGLLKNKLKGLLGGKNKKEKDSVD